MTSRKEKRNQAKQKAREASPLATISADDERWFRAIADYTNDWESWHNPEGKLLWVNRAVERMTGYSVAECLAMPDYPLPIVMPEDRAAITAVLASAQAQTSGESLDVRSRNRTGESRWMSFSWQPMYDNEGNYLGFRTSVRDVTERHALREQLRLYAEHLEQLVQERTKRLWHLEQRQRQMEKLVALGQLAAGVAHEINNPLAGMRNAFELIKSSLAPDHEHFDLLGLIDTEIERISEITHQMYQLYKRAPQQPSEFVLTQSVREVITMLESMASKQKVQLHLDAAEDDVRVTLVEGEVKQILFNLIRNAVQASPPGEEVLVRIDHDARECSVRIEDRGSGIRDDVLPRIFDPFFSTKQGEMQAGMGLGLSVSRSLAEAMGGRIDVVSQSGRGSTFSVVLPIRLETQTENAHD